MANIKSVDIEARVPFHWLSRHDHPNLTDEDLAFIANCFLSPSTGLHISYAEDGLEPNQHGGRTTMYRLFVGGQEAIAYPALRRLIEIISKVGTVVIARAMDIEDGRTWEDLS